MEKEALALIETLKFFRCFIFGHKVKLFCDQRSLEFVFQQERPGKLLRWREQVSDYDIVVKHVAGSRNSCADFLSRFLDYDSQVPCFVPPKGVTVITAQLTASGEFIREFKSMFEETWNLKEFPAVKLQLSTETEVLKVFHFMVKHFKADKTYVEKQFSKYFTSPQSVNFTKITTEHYETCSECSKIYCLSQFNLVHDPLFVQFQQAVTKGDDSFKFQTLCFKVENFTFKEGAWFYNNKLLIADDQIEGLVYFFHFHDLGTCHWGVNRLYQYMNERYYCMNLFDRITEVTKSCSLCKKFKSYGSRVPQSSLTTGERRLDVISVDVWGENALPVFKNKRCCLTIIDNLSKFTRVCPMTNKGFEQIEDALMENWVLVFGFPKLILADQSIFSTKFTNFLTQQGTKIQLSGVNCHRQNGFVERLHRELNEYLPILAHAQSRRNWVRDVQLIAWKHNIAGKVSPYILLFGREPKTSLYEDFQELRTTLSEEEKNQIEGEIVEKALAKKSCSNATQFEVGKYVFVSRKDIKKKFTGKEGPFKIVEVVGSLECEEIRSSKSARTCASSSSFPR